MWAMGRKGRALPWSFYISDVHYAASAPITGHPRSAVRAFISQVDGFRVTRHPGLTLRHSILAR